MNLEKLIVSRVHLCEVRDEPPPLLVVEIVSESTKSTDFRATRAEYSVRKIPEYWIVDPLEAKVTVLRLEEGW